LNANVIKCMPGSISETVHGDMNKILAICLEL